MRPVDKGKLPYKSIKKYDEALPFLKDRIGDYCSYCEMKVTNCLAVEHKESKNSGASETDWGNLLLSCTYCNSRKSEKVQKGQKELWLWPDENNTFMAFSYKEGIPSLNKTFLRGISEEYYLRANRLFDGVGLAHIPKRNEKDTRFLCRIDAYNTAKISYNSWIKLKGTEFEKEQVELIETLAKTAGFFLVWMEVFKDETVICKRLLEAFKGTNLQMFDECAEPVKGEKDI